MKYSQRKSEIKKLKSVIVRILKKHDVLRAGIFGSYARGEQHKRSDVDILIKFDGRKRKSLFDLVHIENELKDALHKKVDLLTYKSLSPYLKERILRDEVRIL